MALEYRVTDLPPVWPGRKTTYRKRAPFKSAWAKTLHALNRELRHLGARKVELALELRGPEDLRQDGMLRADARPGPAAILSFIDGDGHRQAYPCDTFSWWQDNVYAIAIVLEDLRRAERYGVSPTLIRAGFKALPAAGATTTTLTVNQAATIVARLADDIDNVATVANSPDWARSLIRRAQAKAHPDAGGRNEDWTMLQEAKRVLGAHFGQAL